ncbi:MAG TPA: amidohydrolase [Saprospiraceae bacterium]|nr:amidohydrolase [Saprospiraceae bacterium]
MPGKVPLTIQPMRTYTILALLALSLWACTSSPKQSPAKATLLLYNGHFFTADSLHPEATAVAIAADRILAVGTDAEMEAWADASTQRMDLQGAFAMPGFIEGHGHFLGLGHSLQNLNLMPTRSWQEISDLVAQKAKTTPSGDWIEGRGWHQEKWASSPGRTVNGYPYHDLLSAASPEHPVVLYHASGHGLMANARAIELAGISRETPDPIGGRIVRDASGRLTGVFEENAMSLIEKPFNDWKDRRSEAEKVAAFDRSAAAASQECLRRGITSFQDAGASFWELAQYSRLAEAGQLPVRLWAMASMPKQSELGKLSAYPQVGIGKGHFTCRAVKCYLDGALGSYGAWLLAPYTDKPDSYGQNTTPMDSIAAVARACKQYGLQCCVHAIGDRANREVLDTYQPLGTSGLRWRIEHAQHIDP